MKSIIHNFIEVLPQGLHIAMMDVFVKSTSSQSTGFYMMPALTFARHVDRLVSI